MPLKIQSKWIPNMCCRFPPRCHDTPIPLSMVQRFLSKAEFNLFRLKKEEFTTANSIYCHNKQCLSFIPAGNTQDRCGLCDKCAKYTCTMCLRAWHGASDCPADQEIRKTLELAAKEGWQRCRKCFILVERVSGCLHMSW